MITLEDCVSIIFTIDTFNHLIMKMEKKRKKTNEEKTRHDSLYLQNKMHAL